MHIRKTIIGVLLLLLTASGGWAQKIGYTNVELLLAYMPGSKIVEKEIETFAGKLDEQIKNEYGRYEKLVAEFYAKEEKNAWKSEQEKEGAIQEITTLEGKIQKMQSDSEQKLAIKQQELMQPLIEELQTAINAIAKEGSYDYILNATSGMNILYGAENLDVTELLAKKLNITLPDE